MTDRRAKLLVAGIATLAVAVPLALCVNRVVEGRQSSAIHAESRDVSAVLEALGLRSPGERGWYEQVKLRRDPPWACAKCVEAPGEPFVPEAFTPTEPVGPFARPPEPTLPDAPVPHSPTVVLVEGVSYLPPISPYNPWYPPQVIHNRKEPMFPAIPEPMTWLQMALGFALLGGALRLRRWADRRGAA